MCCELFNTDADLVLYGCLDENRSREQSVTCNPFDAVLDNDLIFFGSTSHGYTLYCKSIQ